MASLTEKARGWGGSAAFLRLPLAAGWDSTLLCANGVSPVQWAVEAVQRIASSGWHRVPTPLPAAPVLGDRRPFLFPVAKKQTRREP